jgi:hypothetical protein
MARSTGQKVLIGCGVAAVVATMLGVGSCVAFVVWLGRPGPMLRGQSLVGPDTEGYVEWTLRLEDPGTREAVDSLFETVRDVQRRSVPESGRGVLGWIQDATRRRNERQIRELFPAVLVWCAEPGGSRGMEHVFAASLHSAGNRFLLLDWVLGRVFSPATSESYGDERIYRMGPSAFAVFLREGSVYIASSDRAARGAIDRLSGPAGESRIGGLLDEVPAESPLRGALRNEQGEAVALLATLGLWPQDSEEAERLGRAMRDVLVRGGFDEHRALSGELRFHCDDPGCGTLLQRLAGKELLSADESRSLRLAGTEPGAGRLEFRVDDPMKELGHRLQNIFSRAPQGDDGDEEDEPSETDEDAPERMEARAR